jgi:hypothetical protein
MAGNNIMKPDKFKTRLESGRKEDIEKILTRIRGALATFRYLDSTGTPEVNRFLTTIINNMEKQWRHSQDVWNAANPNDQTTIADFWKEWAKDFFDNFIVDHTKKWCTTALGRIREAYESSSAAHAQSVIDAVTMYEAELEDIKVNTDMFFEDSDSDSDEDMSDGSQIKARIV